MRTPLFNVRLGSNDRQLLAEIAHRDGITLSDAFRKLLHDGYAKDRAPADHQQDGAVSLSGP